MTELHPGQVRRVGRRDGFALRGLGALGLVAMLPGGAWANEQGCHLLIRWSGARLPLPSLNPGAERVASIVGQAFGSGATLDILEWSDVGHAADTVYHYAAIAVSGGGLVGRINEWTVKTRVFDGAGQLVGLLPNTPAALSLRVLPGNKPLLAWSYSQFGQQVAPADFKVYAAVGAASFNFAAPIGTVEFSQWQTRYAWEGAALSPGDEVHYTVRARSSGGVLSLIPRLGACPAESYDSVEQARCPKLIVPAGPPAAPESLMSEVVA